LCNKTNRGNLKRRRKKKAHLMINQYETHRNLIKFRINVQQASGKATKCS
jgi:hypothetical protein